MRLIRLTFAAALVAAPASAQIIADMTPTMLQQAIAEGKKSDDVAAGSYAISMKPSFFENGTVLGTFSTPYSRVVQAARSAFKTYKDFTPADVAPELLEPTVHVYAAAHVETH